MPLPTIQFRYRPAKNKLQDVVFGEIFCLFLWYVLLFKRSGLYDWSDYALWAVAMGGTATLSICLFNYCRGGRIITLMDKAIIIPASYYLSFRRRFTVDYGDIARITEQYCERHGTPGIFITAHDAGKRYLPKNFMLSALTVSPICGNAMILLPNCESAQTPHVFNNPYKENSP